MAGGVPMPPVDFYIQVVDILASRYGWSLKEISEDMYWEEVYEIYEYASNMEVIERNNEMKFNYILHTGTKEAITNWRNIMIPFPDRNWIPKQQNKPSLLRKLPKVMRNNYIAREADEKQKRRAEEVKKRLKQHRKELRILGLNQ